MEMVEVRVIVLTFVVGGSVKIVENHSSANHTDKGGSGVDGSVGILTI